MQLKILRTAHHGSGWASWNDSNSDVAEYMLTYHLPPEDPHPTCWVGDEWRWF